MKLLKLALISLALIFCGCSKFYPKADKGSVTISFRDATTNEPISVAVIELNVNAVSPMYSGKRIESWSSMGTKVEADGTVKLSNIQMAQYVLKIDAQSYDLQKAVFDLESKDSIDWQTMRIERRYPLEEEKVIQYSVKIDNT